MQLLAIAMAICVLPVPVPPISTALRCWAMKPPLARSLTSVWLMGVPSNWKSSRSLASGSLAMVSWYLIERACFSLISALSRSPTMRWGSCWRLTAVAMIPSKAAFIAVELEFVHEVERFGFVPAATAQLFEDADQRQLF